MCLFEEKWTYYGHFKYDTLYISLLIKKELLIINNVLKLITIVFEVD